MKRNSIWGLVLSGYLLGTTSLFALTSKEIETHLDTLILGEMVGVGATEGTQEHWWKEYQAIEAGGGWNQPEVIRQLGERITRRALRDVGKIDASFTVLRWILHPGGTLAKGGDAVIRSFMTGLVRNFQPYEVLISMKQKGDNVFLRKSKDASDVLIKNLEAVWAKDSKLAAISANSYLDFISGALSEAPRGDPDMVASIARRLRAAGATKPLETAALQLQARGDPKDFRLSGDKLQYLKRVGAPEAGIALLELMLEEATQARVNEIGQTLLKGDYRFLADDLIEKLSLLETQSRIAEVSASPEVRALHDNLISLLVSRSDADFTKFRTLKYLYHIGGPNFAQQIAVERMAYLVGPEAEEASKFVQDELRRTGDASEEFGFGVEERLWNTAAMIKARAEGAPVEWVVIHDEGVPMEARASAFARLLEHPTTSNIRWILRAINNPGDLSLEIVRAIRDAAGAESKVSPATRELAQRLFLTKLLDSKNGPISRAMENIGFLEEPLSSDKDWTEVKGAKEGSIKGGRLTFSDGTEVQFYASSGSLKIEAFSKTIDRMGAAVNEIEKAATSGRSEAPGTRDIFHVLRMNDEREATNALLHIGDLLGTTYEDRRVRMSLVSLVEESMFERGDSAEGWGYVVERQATKLLEEIATDPRENRDVALRALRNLKTTAIPKRLVDFTTAQSLMDLARRERQNDLEFVRLSKEAVSGILLSRRADIPDNSFRELARFSAPNRRGDAERREGPSGVDPARGGPQEIRKGPRKPGPH